jgi:hypothetical protein
MASVTLGLSVQWCRSNAPDFVDQIELEWQPKISGSSVTKFFR